MSLSSSVRPSTCSNSAPIAKIFMKFDIWVFIFENLSTKCKFHYNRTRITVTLHEDQFTCLTTSHSVLLRMRNISDKSFRENQNAHFLLNNFFFFENRLYEIMWKNLVVLGRQQMTVWRMRIACWIPKARDTHSQYAILIAFHCDSVCTNAPQCYVIRVFPILLYFMAIPVHPS
jgi:hypothetical protein